MYRHQHVISVLVSNQFGALTRIAGLFARRGYNIESLTVGVTEDPAISRMTIVASGDEHVLDQIKKQLSKLFDVRQVEDLPPDMSAYRELCLVKVRAEPDKRSSIIEAVHVFRASVIDLCQHSMIIEMTGEIQKINAFLELMRPYGILELSRTGITGLSRGDKVLDDPARGYAVDCRH